jgi:ABC-type transporter Mla subunit MlaD
MFIQTDKETEYVKRVTVSLEPKHVDILDRLSRLDDSNRSEQLRQILNSLFPVLEATVTAFEAAEAQKNAFEAQYADLAVSDLQALIPELEKMQKAYLGAMSRLEGHLAGTEPGENPPLVTRG